MSLPTLDPSIFHVRTVHPSESDQRDVVDEATSDRPDAGRVMACADIVESVTHVHDHTRERYVHLVAPPLLVEPGGEALILFAGDTIDIAPCAAHEAHTTGPARSRVTCPT